MDHRKLLVKLLVEEHCHCQCQVCFCTEYYFHCDEINPQFIIFIPARLYQGFHGEYSKLGFGVDFCLFVKISFITLRFIIVFLRHIVDIDLIMIGQVFFLSYVMIISIKLLRPIMNSSLFIFKPLGFPPFCSPILKPNLYIKDGSQKKLISDLYLIVKCNLMLKNLRNTEVDELD